MHTPPRSTPPASTLTPRQRRRLHRIVKAGLIGVVSLELLVLSLGVIVPSVQAGVPVIDFKVGLFTGMIKSALGTTNSRLQTANDHLAQIETDTDRIRKYKKQHSVVLGNDWESKLDDVTKSPTEKLQGVSFQKANPGDAMKAVVPGAVQWGDYYKEYLASSDTVLTTLRSSLDVLYEHNRQIEDATALDRIANLASGTDSRLAMGELKVQSNLEIARQLHALRSQQALETSLYAVTESHRIGTEARSVAEDKYADCRKMSALMTGPLDAAVGTFICTP